MSSFRKERGCLGLDFSYLLIEVARAGGVDQVHGGGVLLTGVGRGTRQGGHEGGTDHFGVGFSG